MYGDVYSHRGKGLALKVEIQYTHRECVTVTRRLCYVAMTLQGESLNLITAGNGPSG